MKKILLFAIGLLPVLLAAAQTVYFERNIGWRKSGLELHTFSDITQTIHCSVLAGDDSLKIYIFSGDSLRREMAVIRVNSEKIRGGFVRDGKFQLALESERPAGYHWWIIPLDSSAAFESFLDFDPHKQKKLDQYSAGDRFLLFTVEKKNQSFHIYSFTGQNEPDTMGCVFPDRTWYFLNKTSGFSRQINMAKMDVSGNPTPEMASRPNKMYYHTDSLLLVMDADGRTLIYRFDLVNRNFSKYTIRHRESAPDIKENTFLLNNHLYYVNASEDSLAVEVNDFTSGALLRSYLTGKKDSLRYKNTPIMQEGLEFLYGAGSKELDHTRQLIRKMKAGEPFINAVPQDSGYVAVSVGSYKEITRTSGGGMYNVGTAAAPVMVSSGFNRSSFAKTTHYSMQMTNDGLDFLEGGMKPAINERVEMYTDGIKISETCENLFRQGNQYRYAYYDNKTRKLIMVQF